VPAHDCDAKVRRSIAYKRLFQRLNLCLFPWTFDFFLLFIPKSTPENACLNLGKASFSGQFAAIKIHVMIRTQVIGNLGKDCTTNQVNGRNVINFSVAHSEKYRDAQGVQKEKTIWVECAYWTERPGVAPYLRKGQQVFVEGVPDLRSYTRNDGSAGAALMLNVRSIQLLGASQRDDSDEGSVVQRQATSAVEAGSDDLPF
jgi:single-strand DNA-binding protein